MLFVENKAGDPQTAIDMNVVATLVKQNQERLDAEAAAAKSITMNKATTRKLIFALRSFGLKTAGAHWTPKPNVAKLKHDKYKWIASQDEDSPAQIAGYMQHLRKIVSLPQGYDIADCTSNKALLSIESFSPRIILKGTTDVMITQTENITNDALKQNAVVLIELKKPKKDTRLLSHEPQAIVEHIAASLLNQMEGVLTILTDLKDEWIFYWFAHTGDSMLKLAASRKEAQFLLDNMFPKDRRRQKLPQDFWKRGNMNVILDRLTKANPDEDENDEEDTKPSARKRQRKDDSGSAGGHSKDTGGNNQKQERQERRDNRKTNQSQQGAHHSVALLMDCVDSDLGDEFRTEDDAEGRMQIARRFAAQYFLPNMVALSDRGTLESTGAAVPHTIHIG